MNDQDKKVTKYLQSLNIKFIRVNLGLTINHSWGGQKVNHYNVIFKSENAPGRSFDFYQGLGINHEPTAANVLHCLLSDYRLRGYDVQEYLNEFDGRSEHEISHGEWESIKSMLESLEENCERLDIIFNEEQISTLESLLEDY